MSQMASISASSEHLNRIQTPHSLLWDFGAEKPSPLIGQKAESKFESKFEPCQSFGVVDPEGYSGRQLKILTQLLGQRCSKACAGWTSKHKHRAFPSRLQSQLAATGLLEEKVLPLLLC